MLTKPRQAAEAASDKFQTFRLDPSPALGRRSFAPFRPREAALAFRVTTTTSNQSLLLRNPTHNEEQKY
jgi:hypothetical protein